MRRPPAGTAIPIEGLTNEEEIDFPMDTQQISVPPHAPSPVSRGATPASGVIHVNVKHVAGFTIVGNHLAQHRRLSLVAIGLAVHIQSLPAGAKIGIKALAERFPEGEMRIAAALRELEATGYLHRSRERLPNGRIITRTTSHNQPGAHTSAATAPRPQQPQQQRRRSKPAPPQHVSPPVHVPQPDPAPIHVPAPAARRTPPPPLPQPQSGSPELHRLAAALLADLRRRAPELILSENDVLALTPGVVAWLERDTHPDTIRRTLATDLPIPLKHPAKLLKHRLTSLLPPPLPGLHDLAPAHRSVIVIPLQNCDRCDRAFRSRHPGHCRDCRTDLQAAA